MKLVLQDRKSMSHENSRCLDLASVHLNILNEKMSNCSLMQRNQYNNISPIHQNRLGLLKYEINFPLFKVSHKNSKCLHFMLPHSELFF